MIFLPSAQVNRAQRAAQAPALARNRRVEIVIHQGLSDEVRQELEVLRASGPQLYESVRQELIERFELSPDEAF